MAYNSNCSYHSTRKKLIITCVILLAVLLVLIGVLAFFIVREKTNVRSVLYVEAGTESVDPAAFLVRPDSNPATFIIGVSSKNLQVPGDYPVSISWKGKDHASFVRVIDTVKPTGTTVDLTAIGKAPMPNEFVKDIHDITDVTVSYKTIPDMKVAGNQKVTLLLTDTSENVTELTATLTVIVDEQPPVITGVKAITIYLGDAVSYRAGITVTDDLDPNAELKVDSSAVKLNVVGKYPVIYSATDSSGNVTKIETTIDVREKKANFVKLETIYAAADKLISQIITDGMTKEAQVKAIYNWARTKCGYTNHSDKSDYLQGAYVMLTQRTGDCFNYYAVTKLLFDRLGIDNIDVRKVKNHSTDSDHFWSLVSLDGGETWYHFDATPRVGPGDDFCLVTDAFLDAYSVANNNSHNRDKSLYPATPEN